MNTPGLNGKIGLMDSTATNRQVMVSPAAFNAPKVMYSPVGLSVAQIVNQMYDAAGIPANNRVYDIIVEIDGELITKERWNIIPPKDAHVLVYRKIHGGGGGGSKSPLRIILSVIVVVIAAIATWYVGGVGAFAGISALGYGGVAGSIAGMAVSAAGMLLVNAIAPIRMPSAKGHLEDPRTNFLQGARNELRPYMAVPVVLGKHREIPPMGTFPYTELLGNDEYLRMIFVWGYGPLKIEDIKIGQTPITAFTGVEIETREGRVDDAPLTIAPGVVYTDGVGVELKQADGPVTRTARANADEISVDLLFPTGLIARDAEGDPNKVTVAFTIESREVDSGGAWTTHFSPSITDMTSSAVRRGYKWRVADNTKQYEIQITRTTLDSTKPRVQKMSVWSNLRSHYDMSPLPFDKSLAMTALRIKASDQLQGVIDNLSGAVSSYAPVWDGDEWGGEAVTQNPAALFRLVLMHPANAIPRTANQIDDAKLGEWYDFCVTHGYKFNQVRDFQASVWDTLADIAAAGRAAPTLIDGVWSVTMDDSEKPISQHITPRNSWGFSASKVLFNRPHGFRIRFNNEDNDYLSDERIVYDDGYSKGNATLFEAVEFPGVTSPSLIWKFGRYHLAQARLRPEEYALYMDFEHLACRVGSKVKVSHDIPLWGSGSGRVKEIVVDGDNTTGAIVDEYMLMPPARNYVCRFRLADGESLLCPLTNSGEETKTLMFETPVLTTDGPQVGDLAMFGELDRETVELIVKRIERSADYVAKLTLVDVAPAIYAADQGLIPEFETGITKPVELAQIIPSAPSIASIASGTAVLLMTRGGIQSRMLVNVTPLGGTVRISQYLVRFRPQDSSVWAQIGGPAPSVYCVPVSDGVTYDVQVASVSVFGVQSPWSSTTTHEVVGQTELPANVTGFSCNVVGSEAHLAWGAVTDLDLSHYRIRWAPVKTGALWASSIDVVIKVGKPATSISVPAMVGTYLIKAVDHAGYESETAATATTAISSIRDFNAVETIEQSTTLDNWSGTADGTEVSAPLGGVVLDTAGIDEDEDDVPFWTGTYALDDVVDLGAVYTVRATGYLSCFGEDITTDLYDADDLYGLSNLYSDVEGLFSAGIEIRTTDDDPLVDPEWSAWKPFLVGDYTSRAYQIRLTLTGTPPNITPVVSAVSVTLDMPDRVYGFTATVGTSGETISFSPPFYVTPRVGIAVIDGQEGDAYTITDLDEDGFDIDFTNGGSAVERNITGIAKGYGYKEV